MSSKRPAISVQGLGKAYQIRRQQATHTTLADALWSRLRRPVQRAEYDTFWALRDVSFEIAQGEIVGIIGRNGAGKSTLLKILSRITRPTTGEVDLHGRVGSLLEVGTGFHQELTGRENIFLSGTILGMSRQEIRKQFDAIVDFAGVEQFLDTPVKRYSSGMYVRLAFAVAAHLEPEILIIDEVLAVGDAEFQNKCLGKMHEVSRGGRTVLFVSHHMHSVAVLCTRAILLRAGEVECDDTAASVIARYQATTDQVVKEARKGADLRPGTGEYRFVHLQPAKRIFDAGEEINVAFQIERQHGNPLDLYTAAEVYDETGAQVVHCDSRLLGYWLSKPERLSGTFRMRTPWLKPGRYSLDLFICTTGAIVDACRSACVITVSSLLPYPQILPEHGINGLVLSDYAWTTDNPPIGLQEVLQ